LAKLFRKKITIFHQGDLVLPTKTIMNSVIEKSFDLMTLLSCQLADTVSTYTEDYARHSRVLHNYPHKWHNCIIPLSQGTHHPSEVADLKKARKKYQFVVGFAGRAVEEKGFDILWKAIPKIIKALPNTHFVFAGEKDMGYEHFFQTHHQLYKQVEKHMTVLGLLNEAQLQFFYSNINVLAMPSRSDCFGLVQVEALRASVPVVVSDIPGARVLVRESGYGALFEKENADDLAQQLIHVLQHPPSQIQLQTALRLLGYQAAIRHSAQLFK
jgi:glycosyltransferase involved in cell wall biosynthesis